MSYTRITFSDTIDTEKESTLAVLTDGRYGAMKLGFDLNTFPEFVSVYPEGHDFTKDPFDDSNAVIGRIAVYHTGDKLIADPHGFKAQRLSPIVGANVEEGDTVASYLIGFSARV